jgi:hypothetical protein
MHQLSCGPNRNLFLTAPQAVGIFIFGSPKDLGCENFQGSLLAVCLRLPQTGQKKVLKRENLFWHFFFCGKIHSRLFSKIRIHSALQKIWIIIKKQQQSRHPKNRRQQQIRKRL